MGGSDSFVSDLEAKHRAAFQNLAAAYQAAVSKESFGVTDILKLEIKREIEAVEVAALWLADCESLALKLSLAAQCGDGARHYEILGERLGALGVPPETFDPRSNGYSKLFGFLRSLQTTEERACAGLLTVRSVNLTRLEVLTAFCEEKGDADTAGLLREQIMPDEERHVAIGRQQLMAFATNEESQARARRSSYRALELLAETYEPSVLRKFVSRSRR